VALFGPLSCVFQVMKAQERTTTWLRAFLTWTLTRDNIIAVLCALLTY